MDIFPAIDLKNGQCVRLAQGDFARATVYEADPLAQARKFAEDGAAWLHLVDLDGAQDGESRQLDLIAGIAAQTPLKLQVGGGIRDAETIAGLLACGATRVVIGSLAVQNPPLVKNWLGRFGPQRIVLAFDIRFNGDGEPEVLTQGWQNSSGQALWDLLDVYADSGLKTVLCTDVSRDGMLGGSNHALYAALRQRRPEIEILASGGVSGLADLASLSRLGVAGVIIGKALYEGRIELGAVLRQAEHDGMERPNAQPAASSGQCKP